MRPMPQLGPVPPVLGPAVFPEGRISSFVFLWPLVPVVTLQTLYFPRAGTRSDGVSGSVVW